MTDTVEAYAYIAQIAFERNAALATIESVAESLRDEADNTTDPETAKRLVELADQLTGSDVPS
jgi:alcohol dehydrogenase class IV